MKLDISSSNDCDFANFSCADMTMATEDMHMSRNAVRAYSWEVEDRLPLENDAHALGIILANDRDDIDNLTAPWRKFFEPHLTTDGEQ